MPKKYIPFTPNTVEGQAVLDNFSRTRRVLRYRDNNKVYDRLKRGMPFYEVETIEQVGNISENLVIQGDCISACAYLKEQNIKVDLVYIDPPFASGVDYAKKVHIRRNPKLAERIAKAEQELDNSDLREFEDKMFRDIWQKEDFLNWMYENLQAIKSVMSDSASIYMHLDYHIGHYVKILMDEVFGENNFLNEIVWNYETYSGSVKNYFPRKHDTIFLYRKDDNYTFYLSYLDNAEDSINYKRWKDYIVEGNKIKGANYPKTDSRFIQRLDKWIRDNKREPDDDDVIFEIRSFAVSSTWKDIKPVDPKDLSEKLDYATQKPEALLRRIIESSSDKDMIVADFFGGSGVTAKDSNDLGRKFIHCDVGVNSIQTARDRLKEMGAEFQIMEIKDGVNLFRNPAQTMDKMTKLIPSLQQGIVGISKFWFGAIQDSKFGSIPVYVPNLVDSKEKLLDIPLINKIVNQELQNLEIEVKKVIVYYIDVSDYKEIEKFIKDNNATQISVELKDLKNLLHDVVVEDIIEYNTIKKDNTYTTEITKFISDRLIQKIDEFNEKGNLQSIKKGKKFTPINLSDEGLELIEFISLDCTNKKGKWQSDFEIKIDKLGYVSINNQKTKDFWNGKIESNKKPLRLKIRNISGDESVLNL